MKQNKKTGKKKLHNETGTNLRILAAAMALTGVCGGAFFAFSNTALAAELGKAETIPTTYAQPKQMDVSKTEEASSAQAYEAEYLIIEETQYYENDKVKESELSKEEAAKIGVSFLNELYDADFNGTYVYMGYMSGTETLPRSFWSGEVCFTDSKRKPDDTRYHFMLDATTGELFTASFSKMLDVKVSLDYDAALAKDHGEYDNIAMQFVKDHGLLMSQPDRVEYSGQGYQGNDPDISFIVYGADGEKVIVNFSRYDKRFKGLITQASISLTENVAGE